VEEVGGAGDAEGYGYWRRDAFEDDVDGVGG